jgi:hypothetical protein
MFRAHFDYNVQRPRTTVWPRPVPLRRPAAPSSSPRRSRSPDPSPGTLNPRARTLPAAAMEDEEMEKKVQQYLQRKGFRLTELALQEERNRLSTSAGSDVALAR